MADVKEQVFSGNAFKLINDILDTTLVYKIVDNKVVIQNSEFFEITESTVNDDLSGSYVVGGNINYYRSFTIDDIILI